MCTVSLILAPHEASSPRGALPTRRGETPGAAFRSPPYRYRASRLTFSRFSYSSFAVCLDHVRGPFAVQLVGEAYGIDGMTFALGGTSFDYLKEIPVMSKFEVENRLLGYDRKWVSAEISSLGHLAFLLGPD